MVGEKVAFEDVFAITRLDSLVFERKTSIYLVRFASKFGTFYPLNFGRNSIGRVEDNYAVLGNPK